VLAVSGGGTTDGTNVILWDRALPVHPSQQWKLIYNKADGTYKLLNPQSMKVLDIRGAGTASGTNLDIYSDLNGANQKWVPSQVTTLP
jgi:hypothetical protein